MGVAQILLDDLDLSNIVIGWYKLFGTASLVSLPPPQPGSSGSTSTSQPSSSLEKQQGSSSSSSQQQQQSQQQRLPRQSSRHSLDSNGWLMLPVSKRFPKNKSKISYTLKEDFESVHNTHLLNGIIVVLFSFSFSFLPPSRFASCCFLDPQSPTYKNTKTHFLSKQKKREIKVRLFFFIVVFKMCDTGCPNSFSFFFPKGHTKKWKKKFLICVIVLFLFKNSISSFFFHLPHLFFYLLFLSLNCWLRVECISPGRPCVYLSSLLLCSKMICALNAEKKENNKI